MTPQDVLDAAKSAYGDRFAYWLSFIQEHEEVLRKGVIVTENVPGDDGGLTFDGVDKSSHPKFDFKNPKPVDVVNAYAEDWNAVKAGQLPEPVGEVVANYNVNCGVHRATELLQRAVGVEADGILGAETLAACKAKSDTLALALAVVGFADAFYKGLASARPVNEKFLKGWLNRDTDLRTFAKDEPKYA